MSDYLKNRLEKFDAEHLSRLEHVGFDSNRSRKALPPLQTLVAFEAAIRLQSFTHAATELNLTQPAISQQVKFLEDRLGVALFSRSNNRIVPTEAGEVFGAKVGTLLDELGESVSAIKQVDGRSSLTVSLLPSFASTWFANRVGRFEKANPSIDLVILSTVAKTEFGQEDADVAIRWGPGGSRDLYEEQLLSEQHILVASPATAAALGDTANIDQLAGVPFVHDTDFSEWRTLIAQNGGNPDAFQRGLYFGDAAATLNAIAAGHGIGVVRDVLAESLLQSGQLLQLPFTPVVGPFAYYFLCPKQRLGQPRVQAFLQWLRREVASA